MWRQRVSFGHYLIRETLFPILLMPVIVAIGCTSLFIPAKSHASLTVTSSETSSTYGEAVSFTATASDDVIGGTIVFYDAGKAIGEAPLQNHCATLTISSLQAGSHAITVAWQGNAIAGSIASLAITQTVKQAKPSVVWSTPEPITYGTALSATQLDATSGEIAGVLTYAPGLGTVLSAGPQTLFVTFTPTDSIDYTEATQTVQVTVNRAVPAIVWQTPASIDYGAGLSAMQLNASSPVAGTFAYSPPLGTILDAGPQTLTATFTPTDFVDYSDATASVTQTVIRPSITVSAAVSTLLVGSSTVFAASVTGSVNPDIRWEVDGIPGGNARVGIITPGGAYTAPDSSHATTTISAVLQANPAFQGSTEIQIVGPDSSPGTIGFAYSMPVAANTSAGVYDMSGDLVRTLWSSDSLAAGPQSASWDGKDDFGNPAPSGSYQIRVLYNNVTYDWGLIGDTSASWTATNSWDRQNLLPKGIAVIGDTAYVADGYEERRPNASRFSLSNPQQAEVLIESSTCIQAQFIATDGKLLYFANTSNGYSGSVPYLFAFDPSSNQYYQFPMGTSKPKMPPGCYGTDPTSVIDYVPPPPGVVPPPSGWGFSGLAVQSQGNLLAAAHGAAPFQPSLDVIRLFDKTTGAPVGLINIANPQGLAFEKNGNLWAISGNSVVLISGVGGSNTIVRQLPDLSAPLAVAVDPSTNDVLVSDGGTSQQIKRFSEAGQLLTAYGDIGGYTNCDPTVTPSRLFLDPTAGPGRGFVGTTGGGGSAFLTVLADGSFWFGDPGNARALHVSAQGHYIEQIAFLNYSYRVAVDHGNPTRVFEDGLEYRIDYTKPLLPGDPDPAQGGNGSWSLVKNWTACLPSNYPTYFLQVQTFPNGRTYATMMDYSANPWWSAALAELPASGPLQFSGKRLTYDVSGVVNADKFFTHAGNLAWWTYHYNSYGADSVAYQQDLLGYDADGWPLWGTPYRIASQTAASAADPAAVNGCCQFWWPEATTGGILATFRSHPSSAATNHHLGGIRIGESTWSWKASPGGMITVPDGKGTFPDSQITNDGLAVLVEGNYIFEGYGGNNLSFSSQWMQWSQDGLLVGQFGHPAYGLYVSGLYKGQIGPAGMDSDGTLFPGAAGNNISMATATVNGNIYLYSSDEGYHHGIHQWKISGLDTVHELAGSASVGGTAILQ